MPFSPMREFLRGLRARGGLREPGLVTTAILVITSIVFFRVALLPEMGRDLSMSTFALGLVTTIFAVGRLIADLPGGHFADRVRAPRLMAIAAGGTAVGSLLLGVSLEVITIYVGALVLGVSSATSNATGMTFFSNIATTGRRGTSMAVFSAALLGGQALGPALGGLLSSVGGWRFAMVTGAIAAAAVATILLVDRSSRVASTKPDPVAQPPRDDAASSPLAPLIVLQGISFAVFLTLGSVPQTLVPVIGAADLGLSTAAIGLALGLGGLARFVGTIFGGWLSDRVSRKAALIPGLLGQAAGVALLMAQPTLLTWLSAIVIMSLSSFAISVAATIVGDIAVPGQVGRQLGRFRFVGDIGLITGPLVVSALYETVGQAAAFGLVTLILVTAAALSWRLLPGERHAAVA